MSGELFAMDAMDIIGVYLFGFATPVLIIVAAWIWLIMDEEKRDAR